MAEPNAYLTIRFEGPEVERSENQLGLEGLDFGEQTYRALIGGMGIATGSGDSLPPGFDLGVLMKLRDIGKLFSRGVDRMEFTLNHHTLPVKASFDREKCDRIRQRIEQPEAQRQSIEGRLLMADFKETGRQLRVHPPVGPAIICKFPESLTAEVEECIRQFVRVSGKMLYYPTGEPNTWSLPILNLWMERHLKRPSRAILSGRIQRLKIMPGAKACNRLPTLRSSTAPVHQKTGKVLMKRCKNGGRHSD